MGIISPFVIILTIVLVLKKDESRVAIRMDVKERIRIMISSRSRTPELNSGMVF